jgi:hypothetical protein
LRTPRWQMASSLDSDQCCIVERIITARYSCTADGVPWSGGSRSIMAESSRLYVVIHCLHILQAFVFWMNKPHIDHAPAGRGSVASEQVRSGIDKWIKRGRAHWGSLLKIWEWEDSASMHCLAYVMVIL